MRKEIRWSERTGGGLTSNLILYRMFAPRVAVYLYASQIPVDFFAIAKSRYSRGGEKICVQACHLKSQVSQPTILKFSVGKRGIVFQPGRRQID